MNIFQRHQTLPLPILWKAIPPEEWYEEAHVHPHRWVLNLYPLTFFFLFVWWVLNHMYLFPIQHPHQWVLNLYSFNFYFFPFRPMSFELYICICFQSNLWQPATHILQQIWFIPGQCGIINVGSMQWQLHKDYKTQTCSIWNTVLSWQKVCKLSMRCQPGNVKNTKNKLTNWRLESK